MVPLRQRLRCEDKAEFNVVASELSSMPKGEAVGLLEELARDPDGEFRSRAIDEMVKISPEHASELAIESLNDMEWYVRITAIEALRELRISRAAPQIARLLAADPDELVRSWAAFALGRLGDASVLGVLESAVENDTGADHEGRPIRDTALKAIARIRLRSEDRGDFISVLDQLASLPNYEAIILLDELAREADATFRSRAIEGMLKISPEHASTLATESLNDTDPHVRATAIDALRELGVRSAAPLIAHLLAADADDLVRSRAASALGRLGDAAVIPALQAAAQNDTGVDHEGVPNRYTANKAIEEIRAKVAGNKTDEAG